MFHPSGKFLQTVESYFFTIYYSGLVGYAEPFGFRSCAPRNDVLLFSGEKFFAHTFFTFICSAIHCFQNSLVK
ncbi:MAG: hypothetical protein LBP63_08715, partial [Prevotellaceae bacterium]|nr:hypothetical protein [Prevotellaceae bacterium]